MTVQRVSSKWAKTTILLKNKGLASYVPTTRLYSLDELAYMLETHTLVYIKPDRGTYGNGVMCAERVAVDEGGDKESVHYILRYETKTEQYADLEQLHRAVSLLCQGKEYLIQQGIRLLKYKGCSFDLRVLAQRTPLGRWESTGIIGRVAAYQKIVTNHHSGGTVKHYKTLMAEHMNADEAENIRRELKDLGVNVAYQLQKQYKDLKEIGLDVAIDDRWNIWILEVNTKPALFPFKKFFKNKDIYRKVRKYAHAYGRKV
ncbi:YheC/YheD family protein [Paenibacillus lemnae]|uniref:YheC/YheD family protein n=1 Tax=Paenibacillus lemnae TaxID=1330551 RepID=A0A848M219_PAELE|nr:YheC/YheD family protein [Paenibacillus lemnae]NMO94172.1 YheC/YheD family protein [Paenibacillus lemnae]